MHHLLLYEYVSDMADRRGPFRDEHLERIRAEREAGSLMMAGAFGDPPSGGVLVFEGVDREHIEAFVADDPYVGAGLVPSHRIEVLRLV